MKSVAKELATRALYALDELGGIVLPMLFVLAVIEGSYARALAIHYSPVEEYPAYVFSVVIPMIADHLWRCLTFSGMYIALKAVVSAARYHNFKKDLKKAMLE